jgi:hypothetical protein
MNSTPKSIPLSSLFDTFARERGQNTENIPNMDDDLFGDTMNDSIFGFMDDSYIQQDLFNWN